MSLFVVNLLTPLGARGYAMMLLEQQFGPLPVGDFSCRASFMYCRSVFAMTPAPPTLRNCNRCKDSMLSIQGCLSSPSHWAWTSSLLARHRGLWVSVKSQLDSELVEAVRMLSQRTHFPQGHEVETRP